jgi:hypothetical protein
MATAQWDGHSIGSENGLETQPLNPIVAERERDSDTQGT